MANARLLKDWISECVVGKVLQRDEKAFRKTVKLLALIPVLQARCDAKLR